MSRSKKVAKNTVTFTKDELVEKVSAFLKKNDACGGDWLNKVKEEFLGQKSRSVEVTVKLRGSYQFNMCCDDAPSKAEVAAYIRNEQEEGNFDGFCVDEDDDGWEKFEVESVRIVE